MKEIRPKGTRPALKLPGPWRSSLVLFFILAALLACGTRTSAQNRDEQPIASPAPSLWAAGLGEGFNHGAKEFGFSLGAGFGMKVLGSASTHDLALGTVRYGWMLSEVVAPDHWYRGNWELLAELFGGEQFHPDPAYFVGGAPHLRYNFATGTRWVPFFDLGAGILATDIRNGDLSTTFEFTLQGGIGVHCFLHDDLAATFQYRLIHFSNAEIDDPNLGANASTFLIGLTWFF